MDDTASMHLSNILKPLLIKFIRFGNYLFSSKWDESTCTATLNSRSKICLTKSIILYNLLYLSVQISVIFRASGPLPDKLLTAVIFSGVAVNVIYHCDMNPDVLTLQPLLGLIRGRQPGKIRKGNLEINILEKTNFFKLSIF